MATELRISPLEAHPADCVVVSEWIMKVWGRLPIHDYFSTLAGGRLWTEPLPKTLVARVKQTAVGTVSLLLNDLETRPEINPWLGCLYVAPAWRHKGIGGKLLLAAEKLAGASLATTTLYLFTEDQAALYARHGWKVVELDYYHGGPITIMQKEVGKITNGSAQC